MVPGSVQKQMAFTFSASLVMLTGLVGLYYSLGQGIKPEMLQWKVFTLWSSFLEPRYCTLITNNQADELSVLCCGLGWILLLFARQRPARIIGAWTIGVFLLGYLLFHGMAVIYFIVCFLLCLPVAFFFKPRTWSN